MEDDRLDPDSKGRLKDDSMCSLPEGSGVALQSFMRRAQVDGPRLRVTQTGAHDVPVPDAGRSFSC